MPHMELRPTVTTCFFLLILILALPCFSRGESEALHPEIYEIDYRGPETHSSVVPPPHHFRIGKPHSTPQLKGSVRGTKSLGLRGNSHEENKASLICFLKLIDFLSLLPSIHHDLGF
ncbi:hypothetical protein E2542_SST24425 [Spatholobus suberectus]|nr:hypothetical protein E2542_SST24425 [Spatholobus suberectus]